MSNLQLPTQLHHFNFFVILFAGLSYLTWIIQQIYFKEILKMQIDLEKIIMKQETIKAKEITYDKDWKVAFMLVFISKPEFQSLVSKHSHYNWNPKNHQREDSLDTDSLHEELIKKCVLGWKGVTYEWLRTQTLLDLTGVTNLKEEIDFSEKNLKMLFKICYGLDNWLIETIKNASNFNEKQDVEIKN